MKKIFLTGKIGIGKSTICDKVLENFSMSIGGFKTLPVIKAEKLTGFKIVDIETLEEEEIAYFDSNFLIRPIVGGFETLGVHVLKHAVKSRELVFMDELGFLEIDAKFFKKAVLEVVRSNKMVFGVMKNDRNPFLEEVSKYVKIYEVNENNRNELPHKIGRILNGTL
jgi:nucleoside-triphosphatase